MTRAASALARGAPDSVTPAGGTSDLQSSSDVIFADILEGLYDGRYAPGQRLIESDLTRRYQASRSSVREALRRLASDGFVSITLHRGAYVRCLDRAEARDALLLLEVLIGLGARLAAEKITTPGAAKKLKQALGRLVDRDPSRPYGELLRARHGFYTTMVAIGGNGELARTLKSMELVRIQFRTHPTADTLRIENYEQITDAILAGKGTAAEKAARNHIHQFLVRIDNLPEGAFLGGR
jgi:DNA-binding GntR family transcriptional regulator